MTTLCDVQLTDDEIKEMNSLSPLCMLASVASKVYDFEHASSSSAFQPLKKKPLPFDLNMTPCTCDMPLSSPIDVDAFQPCPHHKQRHDEDNNSGELGSDESPKKKIKLVIRCQSPELPPLYKQKVLELGGSELRFVIQKTLRKSDVSSKKGCLKMLFNDCLIDFGETREMQVKVYYQVADNLNETIMRFTRSCSESAYVFASSWNDIVKVKQLQVGDTIQVWCFRQHDELSFALHKLEQPV